MSDLIITKEELLEKFSKTITKKIMKSLITKIISLSMTVLIFSCVSNNTPTDKVKSAFKEWASCKNINYSGDIDIIFTDTFDTKHDKEIMQKIYSDAAGKKADFDRNMDTIIRTIKKHNLKYYNINNAEIRDGVLMVLDTWGNNSFENLFAMYAEKEEILKMKDTIYVIAEILHTNHGVLDKYYAVCDTSYTRNSFSLKNINPTETDAGKLRIEIINWKDKNDDYIYGIGQAYEMSCKIISYLKNKYGNLK